MSYELSGKLIAKYDTVQRTEKFKVREFAVEKTEDIGGRTIVNYAKFQCVQDKTAIVDKVNVGDDIKVYFNILTILILIISIFPCVVFFNDTFFYCSIKLTSVLF